MYTILSAKFLRGIYLMAWHEIFEKLLLPKNEDAIKHSFAKIRDSIRAIIDLTDSITVGKSDKADPKTKTLLQELQKAIADFSWSPILHLCNVVPFYRRTSIKQAAASLRAILSDFARVTNRDNFTEHTLAAIRDDTSTIRASFRKFDSLEVSCLLSARRQRFVIRCFLAVIIILAIVATPIVTVCLLQSQASVEPELTEVLFPIGPHEKRYGNELSSKPANLDEFMLEFSKFYFNNVDCGCVSSNHNNRFGEIFLEAAKEDLKNPLDVPPAPHQRIKVVLKNGSFWNTRFISSIETRVQLLEPLEFPWNKLTVTPSICISHLDGCPNIFLHSVGIGPAVNLSWTLKNDSGTVLYKGKRWIVNELGFIDLTSPGETVHNRVVNEETREFFEPLYLEVSKAKDNIDKDDFIGPDNKRYKIIRTPSQLSDITKTFSGNNFILMIAYQSIRGESYDTKFTGKLPNDIIYYATAPKLLEQKPGTTVNPGEELCTYQPCCKRLADVLVAAFIPPAPQPEGVNLLTHELKINVSNLFQKRQRVASVTCDRFLNPGGRVVLYLDLINARTGKYEILVKVDGKEIHKFTLNTLVPDKLKFPLEREKQWKEVQRLRSIMGNPDFDPNAKMPKNASPLFIRDCQGPSEDQAPTPVLEPTPAPTAR